VTDEEIIEVAKQLYGDDLTEAQLRNHKTITFARLIAAKQREMIVCKLLELGALEDGDYIAAIRSQK